MKNNPFIYAFLIGLTSMVGQILLLRELITIFYGNELSIGIILASWLFWVAIGSWISEWLKTNPGAVLLLNAFFLPLNIFIARIAGIFLHSTPGEIIGIFHIALYSFAALCPMCLLLGMGWTSACKMATKEKSNPSQIGWVYIIEGCGSVAGGLLFNLLIIKGSHPFLIALILSATNILASYLAFSRPILKSVTVILFILVVISGFSGLPDSLENYSQELRWRPLDLILSKNSIYGNIAVTKWGGQYSLFQNGLHLFTTKDTLTQEEIAHYPLLEHPEPKRVLLIGGGLGGTLDELLKHPVERVDYVEIDPLIIQFAKRYLPAEELTALNDPRVHLHHIDGRLFVKNRLDHTYDVIIINLPEPFTAQLNRFYSLEFYSEIERLLSPDGVISFGVTSSENYISQGQGRLLASIFATLKDIFAEVKVFPGDTNYFFGTKKLGLLTYNPYTLIDRLKERGIGTKYVENYLRWKLTKERIVYLESSIKESRDAKINKDFAPIGYFYDMILWSTHFSSKAQDIFGILYRMNIIWCILPIFISLIVLSFVVKKERFKDLPVFLSILTTGTSEIVFQIVVILAFQILYGYVYYKVGLILASFMLGLVIGSMFINNKMVNLKNDYLVYLVSQVAIVLYPLILPLIFFLLDALRNVFPPFTIEVIFILLPSVAGFIGGFQFPLANKICLQNRHSAAKLAGKLYGLDLLGSCVGALFASSILLPILGIMQTCLVLSLLNLSVLSLLLIPLRKFVH